FALPRNRAWSIPVPSVVYLLLQRCIYAKAISLCNDAPARLVKAVCAFMFWDRLRAAVFRNGTVTVEIARGCGAVRFAPIRGLNRRSRLAPTARAGTSPTRARTSGNK